MKELSPRARTLVSELGREATIVERMLGRAPRTVAILTELASIVEPALVPHVLPFAFARNRAVARAAASTLRRVLDAATNADLAEIEAVCRPAWWPSSLVPNAWLAFRPLELSRLNQFGDDETAVVCLATFHPNGHVREAAVTRLDMLAGSRVLAILLMRVNDWVTPVARCARAAVERRLTSAYASELLDNLPLLVRLAGSSRRAHGDLIGRVYSLFRAPEQAAVLARGLRSESRTTRRTSFRLARESEVANVRSLLELALADADTMIRCEAVADARQRLTTEELSSLLPRIVRDPFPYVRSEGLSIAADRMDDVANQWLLAALLDRNHGVRVVARVSLQQRAAKVDFRAFYRDALRAARSPRPQMTAVLGLGETGTKADVLEIASFLNDDVPSVRRAAIRALAALDLEGTLPELVPMLSDAVPSVSASARDALRAQARTIGQEALRSILRTAAYGHSRFNALALGALLSKWESLPLLLEGLASEDVAITEAARKWLARWMAQRNRVFSQPTPKQVEMAREAFDCHQRWINVAVATELRAVFGFWGAWK